MITSTLMGPAWLMFFQAETEIPEERPAGGYFDYGTTPERFTPKTKQEEEVAPIIERIAEKILETKVVETDQDIELILRIRLRQEELRFKEVYLVWLIQQAEFERRRRDAIVLLLLH
jgi:hypothetical protein